MGEWGFPLTPKDLGMLIKEFLDAKGLKTRLKDNKPGKDWVAKFMQRHPQLSLRKANLLKRSRAAVGPQEVRDFFHKFCKVAEGVPPQNIFNYDETNFTEDPGAKKALFARGTKYAEKVCDSSKSAISVLFCGSATGVLLPPYVVYKATNCYPAWTNNGIPGAVYSSSTSGWFTFFTVEDWFRKMGI